MDSKFEEFSKNVKNIPENNIETVKIIFIIKKPFFKFFIKKINILKEKEEDQEIFFMSKEEV